MIENMNSVEAKLVDCAHHVKTLLEKILTMQPKRDEISRPEKLLSAMRHGVLNGGKRIRPFLVTESTALFHGNAETALRIGAAIEAVHCYSLIHDDLPAMDNDDLRRGKPTVHIAFDEATAILAGDALLTLAFDLISDDATELPATTKIELISCLSRVSGCGGLVGGQILDLAGEHHELSEQEIITLQAMKTGALIRFSCKAGPIIANAPFEDRERLSEFGAAIGLAFQLADDLLDVTADTNTLGKTAGKDVTAAKATLVSLHGVDWARNQLNGLIQQAEDLLKPYGDRSKHLGQIARYIIERKN